ncbi:MAG: sigma-70 family RNA polymerase sigma factor [Planctomycetota bacterium]|nr:sigma-70 family RNA polymerase sigma factor [Planctomycetota bacterium]
MSIAPPTGAAAPLPPASATLEIEHPHPSVPNDHLAVASRTQRLLETPIEFVCSASFDATAMGEQIRQTLTDLVTQDPLDRDLPQNLPGHLARLCECSRLGPQEEQRLFRTMNFLKFRAQERRRQLHEGQPDPELLVAIEEDLQNAEQVRNHIIRANTRLVFAVIRKFVNPQHSFDDLLSDGIFTLIRAVDKFDTDRGFRFSTYAYRAITSNTCRKIANRQKELARQAASANQLIYESLETPTPSGMNEQTWTQLNDVLTQLIQRLDRREQLILRSRHALGSHRTTHTFQDLANRLGISKERVRQLEHRAVQKLRNWAAEQSVQDLVDPVLT